MEDYSGEWIEAAIKEAVRNNARNWAYVEAILKRWKVDGFQSRKNGKRGSRPTMTKAERQQAIIMAAFPEAQDGK
jgi:DNA replication protein DnaD